MRRLLVMPVVAALLIGCSGGDGDKDDAGCDLIKLRVANDVLLVDKGELTQDELDSEIAGLAVLCPSLSRYVKADT